jgi:hypothetical protein
LVTQPEFRDRAPAFDPVFFAGRMTVTPSRFATAAV